MENRGQVDVIHFDFTKAFDKMPHSLLLKKLSSLGLNESIIKWLGSYLKSRTFVIRFEGHISEECFRASSGVPQGSSLGPLLFVIFIDDIKNFISAKFQVYADDLKIYHQINNITDCEVLQRNVNRVVQWAKANHMPLNLNKTKHICLSRKTNTLIHTFTIDGIEVRTVNSVRDLGILFDEKLYFNDHINHVVGRARRDLGLVLWMSRHFADASTCVLLYKSLVRSHLEYASVAWNSERACTSSLVEGVQNRFLNWLRYRFPKFANRGKDDIRRELDLPLLEHRRTYFDLVFFHRNLHGKLPICTPIGIRQQISTRFPRKFITPIGKTITPIPRCTSVAVQYDQQLDFWQEEHLFRQDVLNKIK